MLAIQEDNLHTREVSHMHVKCFCKSLGLKDAKDLEKISNSKFKLSLVESQDLPCYKCGKVIQDDKTVYVRAVARETGSIVYKIFRKIGRGIYELHPGHLNAGFGSRARAEKYAREMCDQ